jgi:hypothetical protein
MLRQVEVEHMPYGSYCTQIDPSGSGGMRCGPASVASVLLDDGYQSDPWQLTLQLDAEIDPDKDGTTADELIALGGAHGLSGNRWYSWDDAKVGLSNGGAVLCLLDNRYLLPRSYPAGENWNAMHWIRVVVHSDRDDMCYVYDPLTYLYQPDGTAYQGPVASTAEQIMEAIMATPYAEAGCILWSQQGRDLNAR